MQKRNVEKVTLNQDHLNVMDENSIISITNLAGIIIYANKKFLEISQYTEEELIGFPHNIVNSGHHSKEVFQDLWRTVLSGKTWRGEVKNRKKDGSFYWVFSTVSPIYNSSGKIEQLISVRQDITKEKEATAVKTYFLTATTHEIRTPLNGILANINLINHEDLNKKAKNFIQESEMLARFIKLTLDKIVDYTTLSQVRQNQQCVNFGEYVKKLSNTLNSLFKDVFKDIYRKNNNLTLEIKSDIKPDLDILIDCYVVEKILFYALENAVKFTDFGTLVFQISTYFKQNNYFIKFEIIDEGIGILNENSVKFDHEKNGIDNFLNQTHTGIKVGFSIILELAKVIGGEISLKNNGYSKSGATFSLDVGVKYCASKKTAPKTKKMIQNLNVLIVEDNPVNSKILVQILKLIGVVQVTLAANGLEGLNLYMTQEFDLVFMDIQMPIMDGTECTQKIRLFEESKKKTSTPIVALTAHATGNYFEEIKHFGFNSLFVKPINKDMIHNAIKDYFED